MNLDPKQAYSAHEEYRCQHEGGIMGDAKNDAMTVIQFIITADEESRCPNHAAWNQYVNGRILAEMVSLGYLREGDDVAPFDIEVNIIPDVVKNLYVVRASWKTAPDKRPMP